MKLCEKCRAHNADNRVFCVDCGATLGDELSAAQERALQESLSADIEKMYNRTDPLYVSLFDKIVGALALAGCVASLVCPFLKPAPVSDDNPYLWAFLCFVLAALDAFIPQLAWGLEKFRLVLWADGADDLQPSQLYLVGRRVGNTVALALGILVLALTLFH